jgi:chaperonin GroEL
MVSDQTGVTFQNIKLSDLGYVKKVIATSQKSIFIAKHPSAEAHAIHLGKMAEQEKNMYVKEKLKERQARLTGGIAILRIASPSDYEREYLKLKADDTVKAVQAAIQEGVVRGGGMSLWYLSQDIKPKTIGEEILKNALKYPLMKIIENAGKDYADIVSRITAEYGLGYDAKNDKIVDMITSGIIDPTKVERCAIQNAISAASIFITGFATNTEYVKE